MPMEEFVKTKLIYTSDKGPTFGFPQCGNAPSPLYFEPPPTQTLT